MLARFGSIGKFTHGCCINGEDKEGLSRSMGAPKAVRGIEDEQKRILRLARCEMRFLRNRESVYSSREAFFGRSAPPFRKLELAVSWIEHNFKPVSAAGERDGGDFLFWLRSAEVYSSRNKQFVRQFDGEQAAYHLGERERFASLAKTLEELCGKLACFPAEAAAALLLDWIPCSEGEPLERAKRPKELRFRRLTPAVLAKIEREVHRGVALKKWQAFGSEQS